MQSASSVGLSLETGAAGAAAIIATASAAAAASAAPGLAALPPFFLPKIEPLSFLPPPSFFASLSATGVGFVVSPANMFGSPEVAGDPPVSAASAGGDVYPRLPRSP